MRLPGFRDLFLQKQTPALQGRFAEDRQTQPERIGVHIMRRSSVCVEPCSLSIWSQGTRAPLYLTGNYTEIRLYSIN